MTDKKVIAAAVKEAIAPLLFKIEELSHKVEELQRIERVEDINILPTAKSWKILGYKSHRALNRAINDGTFRHNLEWFDYRKEGSKKADHRLNIKACQKRLKELSKQRAFFES